MEKPQCLSLDKFPWPKPLRTYKSRKLQNLQNEKTYYPPIKTIVISTPFPAAPDEAPPAAAKSQTLACTFG